MKHNYLVAKLILILGLSFCYNAQAQGFVEYAKQKQQEVAERRRVEKQKYEEACQKGTLSALQDYNTPGILDNRIGCRKKNF